MEWSHNSVCWPPTITGASPFVVLRPSPQSETTSSHSTDKLIPCSFQNTFSKACTQIILPVSFSLDATAPVTTTTTTVQQNMTATTMATSLCDSSLLITSFPATEALEQEQRNVREGRRVGIEKKLTGKLLKLNFEDVDVESFPVIEWDANDESDSDSVRSLDAWNSFLSDSDHSRTIGKRGRSDPPRRLVRSKKIKSGLSSLAMSISTARTA